MYSLLTLFSLGAYTQKNTSVRYSIPEAMSLLLFLSASSTLPHALRYSSTRGLVWVRSEARLSQSCLAHVRGRSFFCSPLRRVMFARKSPRVGAVLLKFSR